MIKMEDKRIKYKLGYDYYWNCAEKFEYKGKLIAGASINVLFSPIFDCPLHEYNLIGCYPEKKYKGNYLFQYFKLRFNKDKEIFEFRPTEKLSEVGVNGLIALEIQDYLLWEDKGIFEPLYIQEDEFLHLFHTHLFKDLQGGTAYFGVLLSDL